MSLIPNDEDRAQQAGFTQGAAMAEAENARLRADNKRLRGLLRRGFAFSANCEADPEQPETFRRKAAEWASEAQEALAGAADQPAAAHPNALAGEAGDARLGRIAMRFVDRAGDYCEVDPAERICDEFSKAMGDEIERQWRERMARDAATADNSPAEPQAEGSGG